MLKRFIAKVGESPSGYKNRNYRCSLSGIGFGAYHSGDYARRGDTRGRTRCEIGCHVGQSEKRAELVVAPRRRGLKYAPHRQAPRERGKRLQVG